MFILQVVNYRKRREERRKALLHQETTNEENENEENEENENDKKSVTDIPIVLKTDVEGSIQVY